MYHTEPPTDKTIREWYMNSSKAAACVLQKKQAVQAHRLRLSSVCEKRLSGALRSQQFAQAGNCRCLSQAFCAFYTNVFAFRLQLLQALNPQDHNLLLRFCLDLQQWLLEDGFAEKLVFIDEAMFHVCVVR